METKEKVRCYHCGEDCGKYPVVADGKSFCCTGCLTVFQILKEKDACEYYSIQDFPGYQAGRNVVGPRFAYLDIPEIREELIDFSDGGISRVKLFIPSIHCSSCIWLLENLHRFRQGIIHSTVNFTQKEITVTFRDEQVSFRQIVELLATVNYEPQISLASTGGEKKKYKGKRIYYQLGIAGFCFGNIMLFSFPEYFAGEGNLEPFFRFKFALLNLALAIPVVFYCAADYFISAIKGLRKKMINIDVPIALGITVLFTRSVYEILAGSGPGYMDSLAGLVFFLLIGKWYQGKTYQALSFEREYRSYFPVAVTIVGDDGRETIIPLSRLKPGQRIMVRNQELIPSDAILVKGNGNIDYAFVSGESTPVLKTVHDKVFAGGRQLGGAIELLVEKNVDQSYLTSLWNQDLKQKTDQHNLDLMVNKVSHYFTLIILLVAVATAAWWWARDPGLALKAFTAVLIVACPCALALTIPFASGSAMRIFGRRGFYLKKTGVIEVMAAIDTIVFDKTGTITQHDAAETDDRNIRLDDRESMLLKALARHSSHPLSISLYTWLPGDDLPAVDDFHEEPAMGIEGKVESHRLKLGNRTFIRGNSDHGDIGETSVYVSIDGLDRGYFTFRNKYRPGLDHVLNDLGKKYDLHLLSGDHDAEKARLREWFKQDERLHFRQSPSDKLAYIRNLKTGGRKVMMVGDGLNDAGALKESDLGITIADNVYHFSPACDAILDADRLHRLPSLLGFARTSMRIVKAGFAISFLYNIVGISFAAAGLLSPLVSAILMPLSSVSVVVFATGMTGLMSRIKKI